MNEVLLQGRMMKLYKGERFYAFNMLASGDGAHKCYPRVYVFDKDLMNYIDSHFEGDASVRVMGHIQTNKDHPTHIVAYDIAPTKRIFADQFGVNKGMLERDENSVAIKGEITHIFEPETNGTRICLVTIKTVDENERVNYPVVTLFGRDASNLESIKEGAEVCFLGKVQTHRSEDKNGEMKFYESFVGSIVKG